MILKRATTEIKYGETEAFITVNFLEALSHDPAAQDALMAEIKKMQQPKTPDEPPLISLARSVNLVNIPTLEAQKPKVSATAQAKLLIEGQEMACILDTGATFSIITVDTVAILDLTDRLIPYSGGYITASGDLATPLGRLKNIQVSAGVVDYQHDFVVTEARSYNVLLGMDFLKKSCGIINMRTGSVQFTGLGPAPLIQECSLLERTARIPHVSFADVVPLMKTKDIFPPIRLIVCCTSPSIAVILTAGADNTGENHRGIGFARRPLQEHEHNYSSGEKECLASLASAGRIKTHGLTCRSI